MKTNVGGIDRVLRLVLRVAAIGWVVAGGPLWALVGLVPLATGALGFCPLYPLVGLSTCKK